jgi:hypothetical protein
VLILKLKIIRANQYSLQGETHVTCYAKVLDGDVPASCDLMPAQCDLMPETSDAHVFLNIPVSKVVVLNSLVNLSLLKAEDCIMLALVREEEHRKVKKAKRAADASDSWLVYTVKFESPIE